MIAKIIGIALIIPSCVFAQVSTSSTNGADASNYGVNAGSAYSPVSESKANTFVFPGAINAPSLPSSSGCVLTSYTGGGIGWNAISIASSSQKLAKHCIVQDAIKTAIAMCQYKTALTIYNDYIKSEFNIDVALDTNVVNECPKKEQNNLSTDNSNKTTVISPSLGLPNPSITAQPSVNPAVTGSATIPVPIPVPLTQLEKAVNHALKLEEQRKSETPNQILGITVIVNGATTTNGSKKLHKPKSSIPYKCKNK